jgi:hypothetical protein
LDKQVFLSAEYALMGDGMKDIKVNFVFPSDEKGKKVVFENMGRFNRDVVLTYINNLNCDYGAKVKVLNNFQKL